jgi:hypothetical protein
MPDRNSGKNVSAEVTSTLSGSIFLRGITDYGRGSLQAGEIEIDKAHLKEGSPGLQAGEIEIDKARASALACVDGPHFSSFGDVGSSDFTGYGKNRCCDWFVSGHDFSRAARRGK